MARKTSKKPLRKPPPRTPRPITYGVRRGNYNYYLMRRTGRGWETVEAFCPSFWEKVTGVKLPEVESNYGFVFNPPPPTPIDIKVTLKKGKKG